MSQAHTNSLLEHIRGLVAEGEVDGRSDRILLQRFVLRQDEVAFKAIVRRHGAMVLRVCQRWLKRREDAEDVFQATFLVLARKAGALNWHESIGNWLYSVAHRLALEAQRKQAGRELREARVQPRPAQDPLAEVSGRELVGILDEELAKLPDRYREPLLLHLEGKRDDEAAQQMGCSLSTFKRRLRYARQLLQGRLQRRGFALSAAIAALLVYNTASAQVPTSLIATTVQGAVLLAQGKALTAGLVSAEAVALATGLTHALLLTKVKIAVAGALVAAVALAGTWFLARSVIPEQPVAASSGVPGMPVPPVTATIETTLATAGSQIRQLAFDGDTGTFFDSAQNAGAADYFSLVFDKPVAVHSLAVWTGRPDGRHQLDAGTLEVSADGQRFEPLADFEAGSASAQPAGRLLRAVRVRPAADLQHPLAIREFTIVSHPSVAVFKYPVEFMIDVRDVPEMRSWAEKTVRDCERFYPLINEVLKADRSKPVHVITLALKNDYRGGGVAAVENDHIIGSAQYFKDNPDDVGAIVYLTVNCVQHYQDTRNPSTQLPASHRQLLPRDRAELLRLLGQAPCQGVFKPLTMVLCYLDKDKGRPEWLAQGIADYVRLFKYERERAIPLDPDRARYNEGYRATASFLEFLTRKYDPEIVRKLNQVMRESQYRAEVWKTLTGKTLPQLDEEWKAWLRNENKKASSQ
jgi:RNA polymerase sigma factor (sigma-70 family)